MHNNRACADPASQAGKERHLLYTTEARWPAADRFSAQADRREDSNTEEGRKRHGKGRGKRREPCPSSPKHSSSHGCSVLDNKPWKPSRQVLHLFLSASHLISVLPNCFLLFTVSALPFAPSRPLPPNQVFALAGLYCGWFFLIPLYSKYNVRLTPQVHGHTSIRHKPADM